MKKLRKIWNLNKFVCKNYKKRQFLLTPLWINDKNVRKKKYNEIIVKGDHEQIVKLIKTLYLNKQEQIKKGKKFHVQDMYLLDAAEKMLYEEFSYTLDIQPDEVLPFILKNIKLNEKGNNNV